MLRAKRKVYEFTGQEFSIIADCLALKAEHGTWESGENQNEPPNRYQRLHEDISYQARGHHQELLSDCDAIYSLRLNWRHKRMMRKSLRYIMRRQDSVMKAESFLEKQNFRKNSHLTPLKHEVKKMRESQQQRIAQLAMQAPDLLHRIGYLNPNYNLQLFGLK